MINAQLFLKIKTLIENLAKERQKNNTFREKFRNLFQKYEKVENANNMADTLKFET